jgi:DNA/RNA endonuclease YhcR with UshA esterase domain
MRRGMLTATILAVTVVLVGCSGAPQPTATATAKPLPPPAATATPAPTDTAEATVTPPPTDTSTPQPTPIQAHTPTSSPTPTSGPTHTPEATPTPQVELNPIGDVGVERTGEELTVEGTVVGTASFSAGFKFTLDDGTGQIALLMWHEIYDDCWDAAEINLGATVRASGKVGQYEGELQIQPDFGGDVKAIEGAEPWAPRREIGSLGSADEGQRVMIEGEVVRLEGRGDWSKVFVGDETGEVLVFIYGNVLNRIPGNTALGTPGSRVRVVGTVDVYKGNLEVIPTLPYDVVVLE